MNYQNIYEQLIMKRKTVTPTGYSERHHILPRCLGGSDSTDNLVELTAKEHFIAHLLLTRMYEKGSIEYNKMIHAFFRMQTASICHGGNRIYSRMFERLRKQFSLVRSELTTGSCNNQFGQMWVNNPTLKQSTRVHNGAKIETGWVLGRVIDWEIYEKRKEDKVIKAAASQKLKELTFNDNVKFFTQLYCIYNDGGYAAVVEAGWSHSHPFLVKMLAKYVKEFIPQSRYKRGKK